MPEDGEPGLGRRREGWESIPGQNRWILRPGEMGAGLGHRIRWPSHGSRDGRGMWQGPGRRWDELGTDGVLGGNSWNDRRGRGLGSRRRRVVPPGLWGLGGGPSKTQMSGGPRGSGWVRVARVRLTGVVQEEHQRDSPGQHRVPGPHQDARAEERPGRHNLGPRPHPEEAPRGAGPPRERGPDARRLANPGSGRGRAGAGRLPIGWQLRPSRSSSQQVPEEAEGGAGARAAGRSATPVPSRQVRFRNPEPSPVSVPSQPHSLTHACRSLGASKIRACGVQVADLCPVQRCDD